jgi:hypothetical protein
LTGAGSLKKGRSVGRLKSNGNASFLCRLPQKAFSAACPEKVVPTGESIFLDQFTESAFLPIL